MRPVAPPAPSPIGRALDVGGTQAVVAGVTAKDDLGPVLVMGAVDDPPPPMLQGEGADACAHHHCTIQTTKKTTSIHPSKKTKLTAD